MTETKPKRRWFRFSLRTLFMLVTVDGVVAGWVGYQCDSLVNVPDDDIGLARELFPEAIAINPKPSDFPEHAPAYPSLSPGAN